MAKTLKIAKKTSGRDCTYNTRAQFIKKVEVKKPKTLGDLHVAIMISNVAIYGVQLSWYKLLRRQTPTLNLEGEGKRGNPKNFTKRQGEGWREKQKRGVQLL